ncbi:FMN-binding negative transcriptional regulator [Porticoccaceae bacterium]|nr:FMN-binding negative transcriptional regulator [Porticoccaceae bacterium]
MFTPSHFKITDDEEIYSFIDHNGFGQIISTVQGKIFSTHIPFLLSEDRNSLIGHMALQNPQQAEIDGQEVLITLEGPHAYISPTWYTSPGVPTWNYQTVHIYGICKLLHDPSALKTIVDDLTLKYETALGTHWQPNYNKAMLKYIVGVEIKVSNIQCKYKLSQNQSLQDRENVAKELDKLGSGLLATAIRHTNEQTG